MRSISVIGIFCEDIREEKSGQDTLVGILPDGILIDTIPASLPKLGLYFRMHAPPDFDLSTPVLLRLIHTDGKVIVESRLEESFKASMPSERISNIPYLGLLQKVVMTSLPVTKEGRIIAEITIGDRTEICASLGIAKVPPRTTS